VTFCRQKHLVITRDSPDSPNGVTDSAKGFRLVWCPYVPEPASNGRANDGEQPSTDSSIPDSASAMAASVQQSAAAASDDMHMLAVIKVRFQTESFFNGLVTRLAQFSMFRPESENESYRIFKNSGTGVRPKTLWPPYVFSFWQVSKAPWTKVEIIVAQCYYFGNYGIGFRGVASS
jgi:hypothetical protein